MSTPEVLNTAPHFTPIDQVDEVSANRNLILMEEINHLPPLPFNRIKILTLQSLSIEEIHNKVIDAHRAQALGKLDLTQSLDCSIIICNVRSD